MAIKPITRRAGDLDKTGGFFLFHNCITHRIGDLEVKDVAEKHAIKLFIAEVI